MSTGIFEDVQFHLEVDEPPPSEVQEWAKKQLGEGDDKSIKIYELREMIFERGDVVAHRTDDAYLLKFLRARSFNIQSAYKLLVNYYTFKENNPGLHENLNPLELRFIGDKDIIQVLPYREQTGRRIMIYKLGNWNPNDYPVQDMFKATLTILELGSLEPRAQILGGICIFDFQNISLSHAWQITPSIANKVVELMVPLGIFDAEFIIFAFEQGTISAAVIEPNYDDIRETSFPLKVHAVHIAFESRIFDVIYNIFKPLLNNKMKEKIFFHGSDMDSLHNHIDPKYLPKRYGGTRPNYRYNRWIEGFRTNPKILNEMRSQGYVISQEFLDKKFTNSEDEKTDSDSE